MDLSKSSTSKLPKLYSFAQKYGDGFEDVLDSLMGKFRIAAIFDNGKSYLIAKDSGKKELTEVFEDELVQETRIASKKLSDFIKQAPADKAKELASKAVN